MMGLAEGLGAGLWGAFMYNQGRFTFDAGQKQNAKHQDMNMRITQWQMFREDIRDLFQLTTNSMNNYMVIGTLVFTNVTWFLTGPVSIFPPKPWWSLCLWGNCIMSSMAHCLIAIWLSMHGALASHSLGVKVLTQAIRVPLPKSEELKRAAARLNEYEGDAKRFLQLPNFLGLNSSQGSGLMSEIVPEASASGTRSSIMRSSATIHEEAGVELSPLNRRANSAVSSSSNLGGEGPVKSVSAGAVLKSALGGLSFGSDEQSAPGRRSLRRCSTLPVGPAASPISSSSSLGTSTGRAASPMSYSPSLRRGERAVTEPQSSPGLRSFRRSSTSAVLASSPTSSSSSLAPGVERAVSSGAVLQSASGASRSKPSCTESVSSASSTGTGPGKRKAPEQPSQIAEEQENLEDEDWGGPGRIASFDTHVRLFRQVYLNYACYDAYARIALSIAVKDMLLSSAYLAMANTMFKIDKHTDEPIGQCYIGVTVVLSMAYAVQTLLKLDLYVEKSKYQVMKNVAMAAPVSACFTGTLWVWKELDDFDLHHWLISSLVLLTFLLHLLWSLLLLKETRPMLGEFHVPLGWRSVRYLDIFGWMGADKDPSNDTQEFQLDPNHVDEELSKLALDQTGRLVRQARIISDRIAAGDFSERQEHMSSEIMQALLAVDEKLGGTESVSFRDSFAAPTRSRSGSSWTASRTGSMVLAREWLECEHIDSTGMSHAYYLDMNTGMTTWTQPDPTTVVSLPALAYSIKKMRTMLDRSDETCSASGSSDDGRTGTHLVFAPMAKTPNSSRAAAEMPSKYVQEIATFSALTWVAAILFLLCLGDRYFEGPPPRNFENNRSVATMEAVRMDWPNRFFRPSALACDGNKLLLGDSFGLHTLDVAKSSQLNLSRVQIPDSMEPWRALAVISAGANPRVLALGETGREVVEIELDGQMTRVSRRWSVSPRLAVPLRVISTVSGGSLASEAACNSLGATRKTSTNRVRTVAKHDGDWALYGATELGDVVLLCPEIAHGQLEPVHVVASLGSLSSSGSGADQTELIGVHIDDANTLWVMLHSPSAVTGKATTQTNVRAWDVDGTHRGEWTLPRGRRWAPGLCVLAHGHGIVVSAEQQGLSEARPELWRLHLDVPRECGDDNDNWKDIGADAATLLGLHATGTTECGKLA
eukprot:TRINITY_DN41670_c0_g1_i1.p1 TRINITY_DN41670_c0_g1~~TRINITY_DN41670_c0_g1_i1.p1  ORF type:complete len:1158 (+),score=153.49 TRINITY_DN41670_c0_g1_i1:146-3619(+)